MSSSTPWLLLAATALALLTGRTAIAHTAWLEADPQGSGYIVRFGGHAGVLENYPAEKLREVTALDSRGQPLAITRDDRDSGVRLAPQGEPALMTLFFDNGYWSRLPNGRSENLPMDQLPGAVSAVRAVKYHKYIAHWDELASQAQGQPFELVPVSGGAPAAGETLTLQVLIDGQPAAGIALAFDGAGEDAVSDARGYATLTARPGVNRIWAGQRLPVADNPQFTELSIEYSLVFHALD